MRKLSLALGASRKAAMWKPAEMTLEELTERLTTPVRTGETAEQYHAKTKAERDAIKDIGGFFAGTLNGVQRRKHKVAGRSMITLDSDKFDYAKFTAFLSKRKFHTLTYTTHSHLPDAPRMRILIPLTRDAKPDEYEAAARYIAAEIGMETIDPCSFEINQMMFWPSASSDGEYIFKVYDGEWLDPDEYLREYPDWRITALLPTSPLEKKRTENSLKKQEDPLAKVGIVGDFCRADSIQGHIRAYLSDVYAPTDSEDRWTYIPGESTSGLVIYEDKFAYSHHATDPAGGRLLNAFDLIRVHRFGDEDAAVSYKSMCELALQNEEVMRMTEERKHGEAAKDFAPDDPTWDDPLPLAGNVLPVFPADALPPVLRDYAEAVSESTQTAIDMAAVGELATVSACMRNLYKVEGKPDWLEPTNIYGVIIADPSERKSANIAQNTKPVDEYVREYNEAHKVEFELSRSTKQRLENKRSALVSASKKKGEGAEDFDDALRDVVEQLVHFEEKKPMKVYVDDTTPEKLVETLAENNGAISIISSEGGIFDVLSGAYSAKVNIDVFLKAYTGEHIGVDRIMRNSVSVEDACLTILLSVQPVVIGDLMKNAKFRHRGLTARFLYTQPKSLAGERRFETEPIPKETYAAYKRLIYNILSEQCGEKAEIIRLTEDAKPTLEAFYNWVEKRLTGEFSFYSDWIGKLVGNTLRIAGILARASVIRRDVGDAILEEDAPIMIDDEIMRNAIRIGKYFLAHAVSAYSTMGVYSDFRACAKVVDKIIEKGLKVICRRDIQRCCSWIGSAGEAQDILESLEDYGYVRLIAVDASDKLRGGRPKNPTYAVNPRLFV